nr:immunoglobulin light chain junction region [Macaca mulatta]
DYYCKIWHDSANVLF